MSKSRAKRQSDKRERKRLRQAAKGQFDEAAAILRGVGVTLRRCTHSHYIVEHDCDRWLLSAWPSTRKIHRDPHRPAPPGYTLPPRWTLLSLARAIADALGAKNPKATPAPEPATDPPQEPWWRYRLARGSCVETQPPGGEWRPHVTTRTLCFRAWVALAPAQYVFHEQGWLIRVDKADVYDRLGRADEHDHLSRRFRDMVRSF